VSRRHSQVASVVRLDGGVEGAMGGGHGGLADNG
jgi:hypothetical protein